MNSSLCSLLGIQYPIMQGAFQWLATPELAAAVSNAGGLGTISASLYQTKEELTEAIARAKSLTDKPFCVNISMFPEVVEGEKTGILLRPAAKARSLWWNCPAGTQNPLWRNSMERARRSFINQRPSDLRKKQRLRGWM